MSKNKLSKKKITVPIILLAIVTFGMDTASSAEIITPAPTPAQSITPAPTPAQSITPAPTPAQSITPAPTPAQAITPAPTPAPFLQNNTTLRPTGSLMKWVCKTIMTTVAVSAYVYTVVVTDGVMMVIAREVIKYMTVPAIVCDWFF